MRETPYPQKRQPAKRIALKKHETLMKVKDMQIERLNKELERRDKLILKLVLGNEQD